MPWNFIRPIDTHSAERRDLVLHQAESFWLEFAARVPEIELSLAGGGMWDARDWVRQQVLSIDRRLQSDLGVFPADSGGGYFLTITPEEHRELRPMVMSVLQAALQRPELSAWTLYAHRPPVAPDPAALGVKTATGGSLGFYTVRPRIGMMNRIDLLFQTKQAATDQEAANQAALATAQALLGEAIFDQWIGDVEATDYSPTTGRDEFLLPQRLLPTVEGLAQLVVDKLPPYPYYQISERSLPGTSFKNDPNPADDYPRQEDLVFGSCVVKEMRRALDGGKPFYSTSFSRHGETFCYLKIDTAGMSDDDRLLRRQKIEEKIDKSLRKARAARIVGSGTGLRYIYLDLAVADLDKALEVIATRLEPLALPLRSWLLFHDAEMADEYIALHSAAPAPPGLGGEAVAASWEESMLAEAGLPSEPVVAEAVATNAAARHAEGGAPPDGHDVLGTASIGFDDPIPAADPFHESAPPPPFADDPVV